MNRRDFIRTSAAACGAGLLPAFAKEVSSAEAAAERAHAEISKRFLDRHGVMLDFTALDGSVDLPTPEECRAGKPNALGWWAPIENGAMFNGMYMDAAVLRWQRTKSDADAKKARRLMEGLLLLNSISEVRGFVGRGVSTDGRSHYPMGSNDQTLPWFYGLWRFLESGLASEAERARIAKHLVETAEEILRLKWKMPAEEPFGTRGSFAGFEFDSAPRLLFTAKILHAVTGDAKWEKIYRDALMECGGPEKLSRLEVCERGMVFHYAKYHSWTSCTCVCALRSLWELEKDEAVRGSYARGLAASATLAAKSLPMAEQFNHDDPSTFTTDWRTSMLPLWQPQKTEQEAQELALRQLREFMKASPRRGKETEFIREPASAAWIVTLCPDAAVVRPHATAIEKVITRYDYSRLYYSTFFWVEAAWLRLALLA